MDFNPAFVNIPKVDINHKSPLGIAYNAKNQYGYLVAVTETTKTCTYLSYSQILGFKSFYFMMQLTIHLDGLPLMIL